MNLSVEKIFLNLKVHTIMDGNIIASDGSTIYGIHHRNDGKEKINTVPNQNIKGLLSSNRLISRSLRLGITQIKKLFDDLVLIFCNRTLIRSNTQFSQFKVVDIPMRSYQLMDHNICNTKNYAYYGEYFPNKSRDSVHIYRTNDGSNWKKIYSFPAGNIKHVHVLQEDPYENKIWFSTGDSDEESIVGFTDYDFSKMTIVGRGEQKWRTLEFLFEKNKVYWGMDTPIERSHLIEYNRNSNETREIGNFDGPIFNLKKTNKGVYLIGTAAERGHREMDNKAHIWLSKDLNNWEDSMSYSKDIFPYLMGFGRFIFPDVMIDKVVFSGHGLKRIDKKLVMCDVT